MAKSVLASKSALMQKTVKEAPLLPGCYVYRNDRGKILYIGKAKILRNRVKSYFSNYNRVEEKIRSMIDQATSIEYFVVDSEIEALLLESNLIKKYKPKYNSMLVDDKRYIYVKFEKIKSTPPGQFQVIPSIQFVRDKLKDGADYFGPYPDSRAVKRLMRRLRRIFPYCTSKAKVNIPAKKSDPIISQTGKPCFEYQINLCSGACGGLITRGEYERNLGDIKKFFKGEKHKLKAELEVNMKATAKQQEFEKAARFRNMLHDIQYVGSNLSIDNDIDELVIMKEKQDKKKRAVTDLVAHLQYPKEVLSDAPGFRVECYDISNIQGTNAVGSMVVSIDGEPRPDMYRRFKIQMKNEPNDFAMLQEVLTRRFNQYLRSQTTQEAAPSTDAFTDIEGFTVEVPAELKQRMKSWKVDESFSQMPSLIIIDGGKGQLSSSYQILTGFGLADKIPMVGLAKREEDIFKIKEQFSTPKQQTAGVKLQYKALEEHDFEKIHLPRTSEALYLIQRIRDEAHRFAITYHRKLRSKAFTPKP